MRFPNPHFYAWLAFFAFAMVTSSVKALDGAVPVPLILALRSLIGILCLWPMIRRDGGWAKTLETKYPMHQGLRALCGVVALGLNFYALPFLPLADAQGLGQLYPIFLVVLAPLVLGEYAGRTQAFALVVGLCGALFIARPEGNASLIPAFCVLGSATASALGDLMVRYMGRHDASLTITLWFFILMSGITLVWWLVAYPLAPLNLHQLMLLGVIGLAGAMAQLSIVQAFRLLPAATMAVYSSMGLMWAVLFGIVLFGEIPSWHLAVGAGLILLAARLASTTRLARAPDQGKTAA